MSRSAHAIAFGNHSLAEIAGALRASGLVNDDLEIAPGTKEPMLGWLILTTKDEPRNRRALYVFEGSIDDHHDVYDGNRTVMSIGTSGADKILAAALKPFGGYICLNDDDPEWRTVESEQVAFAPEDQLRIDVSKILGPKQAEAIMAIIGQPDKRKALVRALETYAAAANPFDLRDNLEGPGMM